MKLSVVFSFIIHLSFFALILWFQHQNGIQKPPTRPQFIIQFKGAFQKEQPQGSNQHNHAQPKKKAPLNLGLTPRPYTAKGSNQPKGGIGNSKFDGHGDGYEIANRMSIAQEGNLYPFFNALWHKVDSAVTFPKDFVDQRIKGNVTIQMVVNHKGVFTGEIKSVNGSEPMLNVFVLATLIHALQNPLPENSWINLRSSQNLDHMLLVFQFDFELFGPGGGPKQNDFSHFKNILAFRRDSYADPALNQAIEKFVTRYMPPIIPIPGGFFIDFPRAYQFLKNMAKPTPTEEELRQRRFQLKKEEWENIIRKSSDHS